LNYGDVVDSVKVSDDKFEFSGNVLRPIQGWLNLKPDANVAFFYIENSDIRIQADFEKKIQNETAINFLTVNSIEGSYSAEIQEDYRIFYQSNKNKKNFSSLLYEKLTSFIEENKSHPFSGQVLGELALINPILSKNELLELYKKLDTTHQNSEDLEMFTMGIANLEDYGLTKPFPEVTLPNLNGQDIELTSYHGNILLVDFWASWCAPCREKHPDLIKLKSEFENSEFEIVSVSIDDDKTKWLQAVEKDQLDWLNLIDLDKQLHDKLGISAIPFNYLLDKKGVILGVNLSLVEIRRKLTQEFRKE
jgi:thiol-disulfide isomerase/thioredoxin